MTFNPGSLEKKFVTLLPTQESVQTVGLWCVHYKDHHAVIIKSWLAQFKAGESKHRLALLYLANEICQLARRKRLDFFRTAYAPAIREALSCLPLTDVANKREVERMIAVWKERGIFTEEVLEDFVAAISPPSPFELLSRASSETPKIDPELVENFKSEELVEKLEEQHKRNNNLLRSETVLLGSKFDLGANWKLQLKDRDKGALRLHDVDDTFVRLTDFVAEFERHIVQRTDVITILEIADAFYEKQLEEFHKVNNAYMQFGKRVKLVREKLAEITEELPSREPTPPRDAPSPSPFEDPFEQGVEAAIKAKKSRIAEHIGAVDMDIDEDGLDRKAPINTNQTYLRVNDPRLAQRSAKGGASDSGQVPMAQDEQKPVLANHSTPATTTKSQQYHAIDYLTNIMHQHHASSSSAASVSSAHQFDSAAVHTPIQDAALATSTPVHDTAGAQGVSPSNGIIRPAITNPGSRLVDVLSAHMQAISASQSQVPTTSGKPQPLFAPASGSSGHQASQGYHGTFESHHHPGGIPLPSLARMTSPQRFGSPRGSGGRISDNELDAIQPTCYDSQGECDSVEYMQRYLLNDSFEAQSRRLAEAAKFSSAPFTPKTEVRTNRLPQHLQMPLQHSLSYDQNDALRQQQQNQYRVVSPDAMPNAQQQQHQAWNNGTPSYPVKIEPNMDPNNVYFGSMITKEQQQQAALTASNLGNLIAVTAERAIAADPRLARLAPTDLLTLANQAQAQVQAAAQRNHLQQQATNFAAAMLHSDPHYVAQFRSQQQPGPFSPQFGAALRGGNALNRGLSPVRGQFSFM